MSGKIYLQNIFFSNLSKIRDGRIRKTKKQLSPNVFVLSIQFIIYYNCLLYISPIMLLWCITGACLDNSDCPKFN